MAYKYTVIVSGVDITQDIDGQSYDTSHIPVTTDTITTLDGIDHKRLIREKGELKFDLNPMPFARAVAVSYALRKLPCVVQYMDLQTGEQRTAQMEIDETTAAHLHGIRLNGQNWVRIGSVKLTEL